MKKKTVSRTEKSFQNDDSALGALLRFAFRNCAAAGMPRSRAEKIIAQAMRESYPRTAIS